MQLALKNNTFDMKNVLLFIQFEFKRLLFTKSGLFILSTLFIVCFFILNFIIAESVELIRNPLIREKMSIWFQQIQLDHLLYWPYPELAVFWMIGLFFIPFLCILLTSDQIASDLQRGTLRFLLLRSTRTELLFGRFLGKTLIVMLLTLLALVATLTMSIYRDPNQLTHSIGHVFIVFSNLFVLSLPYIALMCLLNILFKSAKISVLFVAVMLPLLSIIIDYFTENWALIGSLQYALPGYQSMDAIQVQQLSLYATVLPLCQTFCYLLLAQQILARKSL